MLRDQFLGAVFRSGATGMCSWHIRRSWRTIRSKRQARCVVNVTRTMACGRAGSSNLFRRCRDGGGLRGRIRRDAGNGPDESRQLARDCGDHDLSRLAFRHHATIALAQPGLRLPGDLAHRLRHGVNGSELAASDACREAVAVGGLDQQGAGVNVAGSW